MYDKALEYKLISQKNDWELVRKRDEKTAWNRVKRTMLQNATELCGGMLMEV